MPEDNTPQGPPNQPSLEELRAKRWKPGQYWTTQNPETRRYTFAPYKIPALPGSKGDYSSMYVPRQLLDRFPEGVQYSEDGRKATIDPHRYEEVLRQRFQQTGAVRPPGPKQDQRGYWENPYQVARYWGAMNNTPTETEPHPGLPAEQIDQAYRLMKHVNNDKPWWEWSYPEEGSDVQQFLQSIPSPPDELLLPDEQAWATPTTDIQVLGDVDVPRIRVEELFHAKSEEEAADIYEQLVLREGYDPQAVRWMYQQVAADMPDSEEMGKVQEMTMSLISDPRFMGVMSTVMAGYPAGGLGKLAGQAGTGLTMGSLARLKTKTIWGNERVEDPNVFGKVGRGVGTTFSKGLEVLNYLYEAEKRVISLPFIYSEYVLEEEIEGYDASAQEEYDLTPGKSRLELLRIRRQRPWLENQKRAMELLRDFDWKAAWKTGHFLVSASDIPFAPDRRHSFNDLWKDYKSPFGGEVEALGLNAMMEIYDQLESGADPDVVMSHWEREFGVEGLALDLIAGIYADPINILWPSLGTLGDKAALFSKLENVELKAAAEAAEYKPIETLKTYAGFMRKTWAGGETPRPVDEFGAIDRMLAGIAEPGRPLDDLRLKIKGIEPEGESVTPYIPEPEPVRIGDEDVRFYTSEAPRDVEGIREKIEAGESLTDAERIAFAEDLAIKTQADPAREADATETQFINNHSDYFEGAMKTLEGRTEFVDIRTTAHKRAEPTFAGKVAGALTSGGWAALLASGLGVPAIGWGIGALMAIPGYRKGLRGLFNLTPAAQATRVANNTVDHISFLTRDLSTIKNPDGAVEAARLRLLSLANTPHMAARELSMGSIASPEGAVIPIALKAALENSKFLDTHVSRWHDSKQVRGIFESMAEVLDYKEADLMAKVLTEAGAKQVFAEHVRAVEGADDAKTGLIKEAIRNGDYTAESLRKWAQQIEAGDIPKTIDHWFAQLYNGLAHNLGEWSTKWYGVEPEGTVERFAGLAKSAQGLLVLADNPIYFLNNVSGDAVTSLQEGVFGLRSPEKIKKIWEGMGGEPTWLRQGYTPEAELGAIRATEAEKPIREAARTEGGLIQKTSDVIGKIKQKYGFASKWAHASEVWSSQQAGTAALMQFLGRMWPKAAPEIPPALRASLEAIDPKLPDHLRAVIDAGILDQTKLYQDLAMEVARLGVDHWLRTEAGNFNMSPEDARGLFYKTGVYQFLAERLVDDNVGTIRQAFTETHKHIQDHIFKVQKEQLENVAAMTAQKIASEGVLLARDVLEEMYRKEFKLRDQSYFEYSKVFAQRDDITRAEFQDLIRRTKATVHNDYRRYYTRIRANYMGVMRALGLENEGAVRFNDTILKQDQIWNEHFREVDKMLDEFFGRIYEGPEQRSAAWFDLQEQRNEMYARATQEEMRILEKRDAIFEDMVREKYGERAAKALEEYQTKVRNVRDEIGMKNRQFHDWLKNIDDLQIKDAEYRNHVNDTILPLWETKMKEARAGVDEFYRIVREELGGKPSPPEPAPEGEPPPGGEPSPQRGMFAGEEVTEIDPGLRATDIARKIANEERLTNEDIAFRDQHKAMVDQAGRDLARTTWKSDREIEQAEYVRELSEERGEGYGVTAEGKYVEAWAVNIINKYGPEGAEYKHAYEVPKEHAELAYSRYEQELARRESQQLELKEAAKERATRQQEEMEEGVTDTLLGDEDMEAWRAQQSEEVIREVDRLDEANVRWDGRDEYIEAGADLTRTPTKHLPEGLREEIGFTANRMLDELSQAPKRSERMLNVLQQWGIAKELLPDLVGEARANVEGVPVGLFRESGEQLDVLADYLRERAYLRMGEGWRDLEAMLMDALRGEAEHYPIGRVMPEWLIDMRAELSNVNMSTIENTLNRIAEGESLNQANAITRPWLMNRIVDTMASPDAPGQPPAGNPGMLYLMGREQDAAKAMFAWEFEEVGGSYTPEQMATLLGDESIYNRLWEVRTEMGDDLFRDAYGIVRRDVADNILETMIREPSRRTLEAEQRRLIQEGLDYYRNPVRVRDTLRGALNEWYENIKEPGQLPAGDARGIYMDWLSEFNTPEQVEGWMQLLDTWARNEVRWGNYDSTAAVWQDTVIGWAKGEGGELGQVDFHLRGSYLEKTRTDYADHRYRGDWEREAIDAFRTTEDIREAGYILDDGQMLDFSGKKVGGTPGIRSFDHRQIAEVLPEGMSGGEAMVGFAWHTGSVRFGYYGNNVTVDIYNPMSYRQRARIEEAVSIYSVQELHFDVTNKDGNVVARGSLEATPEAVRALDTYVDEIFKGEGEVSTPFGMQRHTLYQEGIDTFSPEFKTWFGESEVVDNQTMLPLRVYHGTQSDFEALDIGEYGKTDSGWYAKGFHFTNQVSVADYYSKPAGSTFPGGYGVGSQVYPVYLKMENPYYWEGVSVRDWLANKWRTGENIDPVMEEIASRAEVTRGQGEGVRYEEFDSLLSKLTETSTEVLREKGYDGVIIEKGNRQNEYIVFEPNQAKSVFNRRPTDDPHMLYQPAAWHGSPHRFDQFTLDHIGSGQGAQAYGWGLYFAEAKDVAEFYREQLTGREFDKYARVVIDGQETEWWKTPENIKSDEYSGYHYFVNYAKQYNLENVTDVAARVESELRQMIDVYSGLIDDYESGKSISNDVDDLAYRVNTAQSALMFLMNYDVEVLPPETPGQVYKVDIPDEGYLLWDEPLSAQPEALEKIRAMGLDVVGRGELPEGWRVERHKFAEDVWSLHSPEKREVEIVVRGAETPEEALPRLLEYLHDKNYMYDYSRTAFVNVDTTGEQLYNYLARDIFAGDAYHPNKRGASLALRDVGINGLKYLDQVSRARGEGTYNYVLFDDQAIRVRQTLYQPPGRRTAYGQDFTIRRGGTEFRDAKAMLYAFDNSDFTTAVHETGHVIRRKLSGPDHKVAAEWSGAKLLDDVKPEDEVIDIYRDPDTGEAWAWTRDAEEKFGKGFEKYMYEGTAPNSALEAVFRKIQQWMMEIYRLIDGEYFKDIRLTDEMRALFDRLFDEAAYEGVSRETSARAEMFPGAEDTPLVSGTPMRGQLEQFRPAEQAAQGAMFETGPSMKAARQAITIDSKVTTPEGEGTVVQKRGAFFVVSLDDGGIREFRAENVEPSVSMQGGLFQEGLPNLKQFTDRINQEYDLESFILYKGFGNDIVLSMIEVPRDARKQGVGTSVMRELVEYADANGRRIVLSPGLKDDVHGTTSRGRLVNFYKGFGFVENKGANKDFSISESMYREPSSTLFQEGLPDNPRDLRDIALELYPELAHAWEDYPSGQKRVIAYTADEVIVQNADGQIETIKIKGDAPEPAGVKMGTYDDVTTTDIPPNAVMTEEGYTTLLRPLMDAIENRMVSDDALINTSFADAKLDDATARQLRNYMTEVEGAMTQTKYAATDYARMKRNAALLDYQKRYGFDNISEAVIPYQFYYGRAGLNWMGRIIDRPSVLANYSRLRNMGKRVYGSQPVRRPGYPSRLQDKIKIPLPFLPDWANGGIYFDPWHLAFPWTQLTKPLVKEFVTDEEQKLRQAAYILEGMYNDEEITLQQARNAIQTQQGEAWERAMKQAEVRVEGENSSPMSFVETLTGYSLPLNYAADMMLDQPEEQGLLPFSRLIKNATAWMTPGGYEPFKGLRTKFGLPERDKWAEYHIIRELGNMAMTGEIPYQEARLAMVEQQGPAWEQALDRAGKADSLRYLFSIFWADFFPEGEERARALGEEFGRAMASQDEGAVDEFFEENPEYEARMQVFDWEDPDAMMKQHMIGQVWDGYLDLDTATKRKARKALGEEFQNTFLNKDTRNYEAIPTETLLRWAQMLGEETPEFQKGEPVTFQAGEEIVSEEYREQGQLYEEIKEQRFGPGIDALERYYFSLPEDSPERKEFENLFPEVQKMRNWETLFLEKHPDLIAELGHTKIREAPRETQETYQQFQAERIRLFGPQVFDHMEAYYSLPEAMREGQASDLLRAYWHWKYDEWLPAHPELTPYITSGDVDGEEAKKTAYREIVISDLWDAYFSYNQDQRRGIRQNFGDKFMQYFINKDTRDYDEFSLEELQGFAGALGAEPPGFELGYAVPINISDWDGSLIRQLSGYFYAGQSLSLGARKALRKKWEEAGQPTETLDQWIDEVIKLSVMNMP